MDVPDKKYMVYINGDSAGRGQCVGNDRSEVYINVYGIGS